MKATELQDLVPGVDDKKFYYPFMLARMLWRGLWWNSDADWSRYRKTIWDMYSHWLVSSARRATDISRFCSNYRKYALLKSIGANDDERDVYLALLQLPASEQRAILRTIRDETSTICALVRKWNAERKEIIKMENEA